MARMGKKRVVIKNPILQLQKKICYIVRFTSSFCFSCSCLYFCFFQQPNNTRFSNSSSPGQSRNVKVGRFISQRIESVDDDDERARTGEKNERRSKQQNLLWFNTRRRSIAATFNSPQEVFFPLLLWSARMCWWIGSHWVELWACT